MIQSLGPQRIEKAREWTDLLTYHFPHPHAIPSMVGMY